MRPRTQGREVAFKVLYQLDLRPDLTEGELEEALKAESKTPDALKFARDLVKGARDHKVEIDKQVEGITHNWRLDRMAAIDRNIIRLGAYGSWLNLYICGLSIKSTDLQGNTVVFPWFEQNTGRCAEP